VSVLNWATGRETELAAMEKQAIHIPTIELDWSDWAKWDNVKIDSRSGQGVLVPNGVPGVYEVRMSGAEERLTIGKASDLRMRIKQGLVKGKAKHSSGEKIRASEDTSRIEIRWAVTDRPAAVEEDLHKKYEARFGRLPKYTEHT
jgi:hypothetical protein